MEINTLFIVLALLIITAQARDDYEINLEHLHKITGYKKNKFGNWNEANDLDDDTVQFAEDIINHKLSSIAPYNTRDIYNVGHKYAPALFIQDGTQWQNSNLDNDSMWIIEWCNLDAVYQEDFLAGLTGWYAQMKVEQRRKGRNFDIAKFAKSSISRNK